MTNGFQPQPDDLSSKFMPFLQASGGHIKPSIPYGTSERISGSKSPKGCYLSGEHIVYDVNDWRPVEVHSELVLFPSMIFQNQDRPLEIGSQISANKQYIGYCIQSGTICVYNRQTRQQCLLKGHQQRVTDMAFCGDQVSLLASASSDGHVFIWSIIETCGKEDDRVIEGQITLSVQVLGEWESVHPLLCWLNQDLVVGIDRYVLALTSEELKKNFASSGFAVDNPMRCHVGDLVRGIKFAGMHDHEVTALTIISRCPILIASASRDGTVRIWREEEPVPVTRFAPYEGLPVDSVSCLSPFENDLHVILTSGNQQIITDRLENSIVATTGEHFLRQLQAHFLSQTLKESVRSLFREKAVPLFENICKKTMERAETLFQESMSKYTIHIQEELASYLIFLSSILKETLTFASMDVRSLEEDFTAGQRRLVDLMHHNAHHSCRSLAVDSNDRKVNDYDGGLFHTISDLSRLVGQGKLEEAFTRVLSLRDINVVWWLCNQVDFSHCLLM